MIIIFSGTIGRSGLGGQAWASLQYLLGLRALGHEVYYLEDCGRSSSVYVWEREEWTDQLDYPAAYVAACLEPFGFGDRWFYRDDERSLGLPPTQWLEICPRADLLLVRAAPLASWRAEYDQPRRRAFVDVDPGFTQIAIANGDNSLAQAIARLEKRFTYGQRIGRPECEAPSIGGPWLPTRPPVFLPEWPVASEPSTHLTTMMRSRGSKEVTHNNVTYGQGEHEFPRFFQLPRRTPQRMRIAQIGFRPEILEDYGWEVNSGEIAARTPELYRQFIQKSRAEFHVPKQGYISMNAGWFSPRSVCYLASGRPVLTEETGFSDWLPTNDGVLIFHDLDSAVGAIEELNQNYQQHRTGARQLAEKEFATEVVLPTLLQQAFQD